MQYESLRAWKDFIIYIGDITVLKTKEQHRSCSAVFPLEGGAKEFLAELMWGQLNLSL